MVYAANYENSDGLRSMFSVAGALYSGPGSVCDDIMLDLGWCNTAGDFSDQASPGGDCMSTCPPTATFEEHDSGETWFLQRMQDVWAELTDSKGPGWKTSYRVIRADGTVIPQPITPEFSSVDGAQAVTFSLTSDAYFGLNDGNVHIYTGEVNGAALTRLTSSTLTASTTTTTATTTIVEPELETTSAPMSPGGGGDKDSNESRSGGGSGMAPIAGGVGAAVVLIGVLLFLKARGGGKKDDDREIISFENPMFVETSKAL
jgi:hypothetical protein